MSDILGKWAWETCGVGNDTTFADFFAKTFESPFFSETSGVFSSVVEIGGVSGGAAGLPSFSSSLFSPSRSKISLKSALDFLVPCFFVTICVFKWFNDPYLFVHPGKVHLYRRTIW